MKKLHNPGCIILPVMILLFIGLMIFLSGCFVYKIEREVIKRDTVYVEKYWGSDVKLQKIDDSDGMLGEMQRISRNLISNTVYPAINIDTLNNCLIDYMPLPPEFRDYKVHTFMHGKIKYYYQYVDTTTYSIWRK